MQSNPKPRRANRALLVQGAKLSPVQKNQVKQMLALTEEVKFSEILIAAQPASTTTTLTPVSFTSQGVAQGQHVGDSCYLKQYLVNYIFSCADATNICRLVIMQWLPNTASETPTAAKLFILGSSGSIDVTSSFNVDFQDEYRVIYDKTHYLTLANNAVEGRSQFPLKPFHRRMEYNIGLNTGTAQLYAVFLSDSVAVSHPSLRAVFRTEYVDS